MIAPLMLSALCSFLCCLLVARLLSRQGLYDMPTARSSHFRPTPKGGGVGMVVAFSAASMITGQPILLWLPVTALAAGSLVNDLRDLSAGLRLALQFMAAGLTLAWAWSNGWTAWSGWFLLPAVVWMVAMANCYNFMDGINGMAGLTGIVAFFLLGLYNGNGPGLPIILVLVVLGALMGFLPCNLPRARIFMGDVGSIFLGFLYALAVCLTVGSWTDFLVCLAFLFPFLADETVTAAERIRRRESLLKAHRRHLYQFLANELRIAHWRVSLAYALIQLALGLAAMGLARVGGWYVLLMLVFSLAAWVVVHCQLKHRFQPKEP